MSLTQRNKCLSDGIKSLRIMKQPSIGITSEQTPRKFERESQNGTQPPIRHRVDPREQLADSPSQPTIGEEPLVIMTGSKRPSFITRELVLSARFGHSEFIL